MSSNRAFLSLVGMMRMLVFDDDMQFPPVGPAPEPRTEEEGWVADPPEVVTILSTLRRVGSLRPLTSDSHRMAAEFCIELGLVKECSAWADDGHGPYREGSCLKLTKKGEDELARLEHRAARRAPLLLRILHRLVYSFFELRTQRAVARFPKPEDRAVPPQEVSE